MQPGILGLMVAQLGITTSTVRPTIGTVNTNVSTATTTSITTLSGLAANTLLVLSAASADDSSAFPNGSVVSSPSLTWTKRAQSKAPSSGNTEIWTALFVAGGTITVTYTGVSAASGLSTVLYPITSTESVLGGNSGASTSQNNATAGVSTSKYNSIFICVTSDWAADNPSGHTYIRSPTQTLLDDQSGSAIYVGYHYWDNTLTTVQVYTEGLTIPTSTNGFGTSVLEIRGV